jgi:hypothetical protein
MSPEWVGWASAAVLLATLVRQVYTQYRSGSTRGVSKWLFAGQLAASVGFVAYSWMLGNGVFVVTNALILLTALIGQGIYLRNRRRERRRSRIASTAPQEDESAKDESVVAAESPG